MTERAGPAAWVGLLLGCTVLVFGAVGLVTSTSSDAARMIASWVVGADLLHNLVVAPTVGIMGLLLARVVPRPWRAPVRAGAIASATVLLVAYPLLRGYGHEHVPDNPSVLPLNYTTALATVLAIVWVGALVWGLQSRRRTMLKRRAEHEPQ
jgi:hypothetical protein